jgi:hypothetical protein
VADRDLSLTAREGDSAPHQLEAVVKPASRPSEPVPVRQGDLIIIEEIGEPEEQLASITAPQTTRVTTHKVNPK